MRQTKNVEFKWIVGIGNDAALDPFVEQYGIYQGMSFHQYREYVRQGRPYRPQPRRQERFRPPATPERSPYTAYNIKNEPDDQDDIPSAQPTCQNRQSSDDEDGFSSVSSPNKSCQTKRKRDQEDYIALSEPQDQTTDAILSKMGRYYSLYQLVSSTKTRDQNKAAYTAATTTPPQLTTPPPPRAP